MKKKTLIISEFGLVATSIFVLAVWMGVTTNPSCPISLLAKNTEALAQGEGSADNCLINTNTICIDHNVYVSDSRHK